MGMGIRKHGCSHHEHGRLKWGLPAQASTVRSREMTAPCRPGPWAPSAAIYELNRLQAEAIALRNIARSIVPRPVSQIRNVNIGHETTGAGQAIVFAPALTPSVPHEEALAREIAALRIAIEATLAAKLEALQGTLVGLLEQGHVRVEPLLSPPTDRHALPPARRISLDDIPGMLDALQAEQMQAG